MGSIGIWHWMIVIVTVLRLLAYFLPLDGPRRM